MSRFEPFRNLRRERLSDRETMEGCLGSALRRGNLVVFLGAGISRAFGLPDWSELVRECCRLAACPDVPSAGAPANELMDAMGKVERLIKKECSSAEFERNLRRSLYAGVEYETSAAVHPLMVALGAMMMGSMRGSVSEILTLNFDDVLEWYLRLHGYSYQAISKYPFSFVDTDVRVYHLHGYLPFADATADAPEGENSIVLTEQSFYRRMAEDGHPCNILLRSLLMTRTFLFLGWGASDPDIKLLLTKARADLPQPKCFGCYVQALKDDAETDETQQRDRFDELYDDFGLATVHLRKRDIPMFLMGICQSAAAVDV